MVILHIIIAFASIAIASVNLFRPTKTKLIGSYSLITATLLSGTLLVVADPSRLLHVCTVGLAYVAIASSLTVVANIRLAKTQKGNIEA